MVTNSVWPRRAAVTSFAVTAIEPASPASTGSVTAVPLSWYGAEASSFTVTGFITDPTMRVLDPTVPVEFAEVPHCALTRGPPDVPKVDGATL